MLIRREGGKNEKEGERERDCYTERDKQNEK
jgi:hypothetical protein